MAYFLLIVIVGLLVIPKGHSSQYAPQQGDIIFQTSRSSQSVAIQQATSSAYSHMGIIMIKNNKPYVLEASSTVKYTAIGDWIKRGAGGKYVIKRVKTPLTSEQKNSLVTEAQRYINKPYDLSFEWSDNRQYCSELVWKIYANAINMKIGQLQQLKEFNLTSPAVKAKLAERYGSNIPLNESVISPKAMFDSPLLITVEQQ
ncbi:YiiX family permuted papain-like enzyme [Budvicia diplopodorum]|uniref:YiiX family permuted papain-like enzyme n=1 Tax=Budvicia diplopodorum TaxID=1119056 RepID=UPI003CCD4B98